MVANPRRVIKCTFITLKVALHGLCLFALVVVALRRILPLVLLYFGGVGVECPLPKRLVMAYPRAAVYLFALGGPLVLAARVAESI